MPEPPAATPIPAFRATSKRTRIETQLAVIADKKIYVFQGNIQENKD